MGYTRKQAVRNKTKKMEREKKSSKKLLKVKDDKEVTVVEKKKLF